MGWPSSCETTGDRAYSVFTGNVLAALCPARSLIKQFLENEDPATSPATLPGYVLLTLCLAFAQDVLCLQEVRLPAAGPKGQRSRLFHRHGERRIKPVE